MNRQALRPAANADHNDTADLHDTLHSLQDSAETGEPNASTLAEDGKDLAQRSYAYATRTIHENPALALAGVVAIGALATLAIIQRRTEPHSVARNVRRDLVKHTRDLRKVVRQELRDSGAANTFNDFGKALANFDWKPYIQPLVENASALAQQASTKLTSK